MNGKGLTGLGSLLGIGIAGYYIYRGYDKSDHSLKGTLEQFRKDVMRDVERINRVIGTSKKALQRRLDGIAQRRQRSRKRSTGRQRHRTKAVHHVAEAAARH